MTQKPQTMKRILSLLVLLSLTLTAAWAAKVKFTVQGTTSPNSKKITVFDGITGRSIAKVDVENGKFTYSNSLPDDSFISFYDEATNAFNYVITDSKDIQLDMTQDKVSGSPLSELFYAVNDTIYQKLRRPNGDAIKYLETVVERHKKECIPAGLIYILYRKIPFQTLTHFCESKAPYTRHPIFKRVLAQYGKDKFSNSLIGKKYTNVTLHNGRGEKVKLSEAIGQGKYVLVDFWASWCGPCMGEMPYLKECYAKYKDKGFEIVGISLDKNRAAWINAIAQKELSWPQYSDLDQFDNEAASTYQVSSIPWNFLCDPEGTIIAISLRGEALAEKLAEVLK